MNDLDFNLVVTMLNTVALAVIAVATFYTMRLTRKTELNTNSMKDALIERTKEASFTAGREEARIEGENKAATLAKGIAAGNLAATSAAKNNP